MFQLFWDSFNWLICMKIVITNNNNTIFSSVFHVASFRYLKPTSIISVFRKFLSFAASPCCLIYRVWTLRLTSSHITQSCLQELLACQTLSEAAKTTLNQNMLFKVNCHTYFQILARAIQRHIEPISRMDGLLSPPLFQLETRILFFWHSLNIVIFLPILG